MGKMGTKREITMLVDEKGLKDLDHTTNICTLSIHGLKGMLEGAR